MSVIPLLDQLADAWNVLIGNDVQEPSTRKPMSPASGDVTQTPEPKSTSGLASVFKSLTGNRTKSPSAQSPASAPTVQTQELNPNAFRPGKHAIYGGPPNYKQLYEQLKAGETLADRLAAADSLRHIVVEYPLSGVMNVWFAGRDLIEPTKPVEARVAGFGLLTACVQHASATDLERKEYFDTLTAPANPQDFHLQLSAVAALAKKGRDLSGFQYEAFPLLNNWLRETFQVTTEARKDAGRKVRTTLKAKAPLGEETNLAALFFLIQEVIKFSFNVSTEETTNDLIDVILHICVQTTLASDLRSCIGVIDAIVTYGAIPNKKLLGCVKILCSIHCLVDEVQPEAWQSISNLCRSHDGQTTVRYLLNILRLPNLDGNDEKQTIREIRGALSVLQKLFAKDGEDGYPLVPFTLLMDGLSKVIAVNHARVETDILGLILSIFGDEDHEVMENVMEEDWTVMFNVASKCAKRALETSDGRPITDRSRMTSPLAGQLMGKDETVGNLASTAMVQILANLINRIEQLLLQNSSGEFFQRNECMKFFVNIYPHLPESCARLVIDYYMEYRMCYPSDSQWKDNIRMMLQAFFSARFQPTHIRLHALKAVTDVFDVVEMMDQEEDPEMVETFVTAILDDIGEEKDVAVLQEVVSFAVAVADTVDDALFNYVIDALRKSVTSDRMSPVGSPPGSRHGLMGSSRPASAASKESIQTPSNVVTKGFIRIFMRNMDTSPTKSLRVFGEMLEIAKSHYYETDARLSALKMLCRLRADWANRIFLTPFTESEGLASSLYRTSASLARKQAIDDASQYTRASRSEESSASRTSRSISISHAHAPGRPPMRTGSGVYRTIQRNHQMWMSPDPDALPEPVSNKASPLLTSIMNSECQATASTTGRMALDVAFYLETITGLLERGCEWEVYSYILVHLASQLSNQALFKAAVPQIRTLRALLCDQLKSPSSFYEPPTSSGLRKVDVGICLYQILTMIMSYHEYFSPLEEDNLVSTFVAGVGTERASKCCIHALSICCHELPRSTSKALPTLLQSMSKIITQSYVAVHILEFLACLARLQNLYSSFRDDDYRTVFAICLRYLEYVRDQSAKEANRNSQSHGRASAHSSDGLRALPENSNAESNFQPNTSDDLPQYVYALAYHVIIFWFLSLKLGDRGGLVTWITKNLISTDSNGKEKIDEQAQVTLDFMQRVAYADVDESAPDPTFTSELFGEILKKTWVVGNSIITVEQATRGECAQITKRQPSGTSCYTIRENFTRPPIHQSLVLTEAARGAQEGDANMVLPSHLVLQLTASIPQGGEFSRPIALPNDEKITRAIKSFDRNSTVDGHKVGVIYIGENQTQEVEILANVIGSSDYTQFLTGLGTLTKLKGATFNTQGLDREYNTDGEYTFCWRDRVTEIVFHVTTQMPTNLDHDPQCIGKKRHIGNDFVNIIFNNSGLPFRFDTFPSEFNYVNIVITPESRASFVATRLRSEECMQNAFYKVQVMSKPGFPEISPAAETKIIGLAALPGFIRLLALNASVFSLVWFNREGGEHISSWRNRLREINRLRENYGTKSANSAPTSPPGTSNGASNIRDSLNSLGRRSSVATFLTNASEQKDQHRSSLLSTAETEVGSGIEGSMQDTLDFSRWA